MAIYQRMRADADSPGGVLAVPDGDGPWPAVIVLTAISGINDYVERVVDGLASDGYIAFAVDYYARSAVPELKSLEQVMAAVDALSDPQVIDDVRGVYDWLSARSDVTARIGTVGFCIGGSYAVLAAALVDGLACSVGFYGILNQPVLSPSKPISALDAAAKLQCPLLAHYGEDDHLVPVADARRLQEATAGKPAEVYIYPGAGHAFHEDFRPQVYRPAAANEAWRRTMHYLRYYLTSAYVG